MNGGAYTLLHGSFEPLVYGLVMAITFLLQVWRFQRGQYLHIAVIAFAYYLALATHATKSGSVLMGISICILILELTLPLFFGRKAT